MAVDGKNWTRSDITDQIDIETIKYQRETRNLRDEMTRTAKRSAPVVHSMKLHSDE